MKTFDPATQIPDLAGKVIFVTGGTNGIGKETVIALAAHNPAQIIFTGRKGGDELVTQLKTDAKTKDVKVVFIRSDQASLASVRETGVQVLKLVDKLNLVIFNAGVQLNEPAVTEDGFEIHFAVNHLAHFELFRILLPAMLKREKGDGVEQEQDGETCRLVVVSSDANMLYPTLASGPDFSDESLKSPGSVHLLKRTLHYYGRSKLANILFAKEVSRLYSNKGIASIAVHPGFVTTGMFEKYPALVKWILSFRIFGMIPPPKGAWNTLWAATAKEGDKPGEFVKGEVYRPVGETMMYSSAAKDEALARQLWDYSEKEVDAVFATQSR